jgi:hypothetical protein
MNLVRNKVDIINLLIHKYSYTSYLEISTPTTGRRFAEIDRASLEHCHRILYRCGPKFDDGHEVTWRSADKTLETAFAEASIAARPYDVVLVDSFHTYACSARDLSLALSLASSGGIVVMHDASPPTQDLTTPEFIKGPWCGQSYAALIDLLLRRPSLEVYVVDVDFGVAVLRSDSRARHTISGPLAAAWTAIGDDPARRFAFFQAHRQELLNLIGVEEFLRREGFPGALGTQAFLELFPPGRRYDADRRPDFLRDLACTHLKLGNRDEARRLLEAALTERPGGAYIKQLLEKVG